MKFSVLVWPQSPVPEKDLGLEDTTYKNIDSIDELLNFIGLCKGDVTVRYALGYKDPYIPPTWVLAVGEQAMYRDVCRGCSESQKEA